jgi:hypothetical protein
MGAIFSRIKNWNAENLTNEDLNAEIDNILTNLVPLQFDDYSTNVAEMQTKTDPGEAGTESLATTLAGELARLRFAIGEIKGTSQWYESSSTSLLELSSVLGGGLEDNRISSGRTTSASSQPIYLVPAGAGNGRTVEVKGATTALSYTIEGVAYTISTDVASGTLLAAPSSNNTALLNDGVILDQEYSKNVGEYGSEITMDTVGSEISSLINEWAAFKVNNGSADEYFLAYVKDATTLSKVKRGFYFNDSDAGIPRVAIANNDTITLMKLTWVFANTAGALVVTYNNPRVSSDEPTSPAVGDYWYDLVNDKWKTFNSSVFVDAAATYVGMVIQDDTDSVGARSQEFFKAYSDANTVEIVAEGVQEVRGKDMHQEISVYGSPVKFRSDFPRWNMATDKDTGVSESSSTTYYLYLSESGDPKISDLMPMDRREDLKGLYHPFEAYRCVGQVSNDASSDFEAEISYHNENDELYAVTSSVSANALTVKVHGSPIHRFKIRSDEAEPQAEYRFISLISPQEVVVPSTATLGQVSTALEYFYLYVAGNGNNPELAVATHPVLLQELQTTVALSSGSDGIVSYSDVARTDVGFKELARLESTQTTAGTWAANLTQIALVPFDRPLRPIRSGSSGAFTTTSTSPVVVTNNSLTFVATGRPYRISIDSDVANTSDIAGNDGGGGAGWTYVLSFQLDGVTVSSFLFQMATLSGGLKIPSSILQSIVTPAKGSRTIRLVGSTANAADTLAITTSILVLVEEW